MPYVRGFIGARSMTRGNSMADELDTDAGSTSTQEAASTTKAPEGFVSQADLDKTIGKVVAKEREKFADYDTIKEKLSKIEDSKKSDLERLTGERDTLKTTAETAAAENLRLRVAIDKKLPSELIDRLKGSSKEELEADADSLLKLVQPATATSFDGGKGRDSAATGPTGMNDIIRRAAGKA
jgi:hypothetical protein